MNMNLLVVYVVVAAKLQVGKLAGGGVVDGMLGGCLGGGIHSGAHQILQILGDLIGNSIGKQIIGLFFLSLSLCIIAHRAQYALNTYSFINI